MGDITSPVHGLTRMHNLTQTHDCGPLDKLNWLKTQLKWMWENERIYIFGPWANSNAQIASIGHQEWPPLLSLKANENYFLSWKTNLFLKNPQRISVLGTGVSDQGFPMNQS